MKPGDHILKKKEEDILYTSLRIDPTKKMIAEQVYDGTESKFCCYGKNSTESISYQHNLNFGVEMKPIIDEEVKKGAILLPSKAEEYNTDEELDTEIKEFINYWLDVPDDFCQFALWNIKRSWVYERFHTLNYLRALGDTGQGKTRFLDTLGALHYKAINTTGATTSAPVFRILDKWKGTLVMDEADFSKSDEAQDIIKIINQGYEKGKFVMRCDKDKGNKVNFFDPYGPKILATRKTFTDKAVESRCITQVMTGTTRHNIPYNLNKAFFDESLKLRNKLLMWRFRNYFKINPLQQVNYDLGIDIEPRVKQIVTSFISLFHGEKKQLDNFKIFIEKYQGELIEERRNSFAGQVVIGIHDLIKYGSYNISAQDIIEKAHITNSKGHLISPRGLSSTLRSLGFEKPSTQRIGEHTKRCLKLENEHLKHLFSRYGVTVVTIHGDRQFLDNSAETIDEGSNRIQRNNRNTVTKEEVEEGSERNINSQIITIIDHYLAESKGKPVEIQTIVKTAIKANISEVNAEEVVRYLLEKGDYYEANKGFLLKL